MKPERCVWKGGVVQEVVVITTNRLFRYVLCSPSFFESCEEYLEHLREAGIDFIKVNTADKEYVDEIERICHIARVVELRW